MCAFSWQADWSQVRFHFPSDSNCAGTRFQQVICALTSPRGVTFPTHRSLGESLWIGQGHFSVQIIKSWFLSHIKESSQHSSVGLTSYKAAMTNTHMILCASRKNVGVGMMPQFLSQD